MPCQISTSVQENNFLDPTFPTLASLASYARGTTLSLLSLQLQLLSNSKSFPTGARLSALDHALSHLSLTIALSTLLQALPFLTSKRCFIIPREVASANNVIDEALFRRGGGAEGVADAVAELAAAAELELDVARQTAGKIEDVVKPVFLAATPAKSYLALLRQRNFDAFHPTLQRRSWKLPFQVWVDSLGSSI